MRSVVSTICGFLSPVLTVYKTKELCYFALELYKQKEKHMSWINNPELTSDQKEKIYFESMEKAMDAGRNLALSELPMFQQYLAMYSIKAEATSAEGAKAFREALELSFFHFKVQQGGEEETAWAEKEKCAAELINQIRKPE
jgi:hypothetical protein